MTLRIVEGKPSRRLWIVIGSDRIRFPALIHFFQRTICFLTTHDWSRWRIETQDWWEYVPGPVPWVWRICKRCGRTQNCRED